MKKIIRIAATMLAAAILAASLAGCGTSTPAETTKTTTAATTTKPVTTEPVVATTTAPAVETTVTTTEPEVEEKLTDKSGGKLDEDFRLKLLEQLNAMTSFSMTCAVDGTMYIDNVSTKKNSNGAEIDDGEKKFSECTLTEFKQSFTWDVNENAAHIVGEFENISDGTKMPFESYKLLAEEERYNNLIWNDTHNNDYIADWAIDKTLAPTISTITNENGTWAVTSKKDARANEASIDTPCATVIRNMCREFCLLNQFFFTTCCKLTNAPFSPYNDDDDFITKTDDGKYVIKDSRRNFDYGSGVYLGLIQVPEFGYNLDELAWCYNIDETPVVYVFNSNYELESIEFTMKNNPDPNSFAPDYLFPDTELHVKLEFDMNSNPAIDVPDATSLSADEEYAKIFGTEE